jgi:hypothetical protein
LWGAVGDIGMRRKAFGSMDSSATDTNAKLFDINDVQRILRRILRISSVEEVVALPVN